MAEGWQKDGRRMAEGWQGRCLVGPVPGSPLLSPRDATTHDDDDDETARSKSVTPLASGRGATSERASALCANLVLFVARDVAFHICLDHGIHLDMAFVFAFAFVLYLQLRLCLHLPRPLRGPRPGARPGGTRHTRASRAGPERGGREATDV